MAAGDVVVFNEALAFMLDGGWEAADALKIALVTSATAPTQSTASPVLLDFTEVAAGGIYSAGGESLGTWGDFITQSGAVATGGDALTTTTWAQNAGNPTNARYGILYNDTDATDRAFAYIDLGAVIDMTLGALTITWNASGVFTITNS